MKINEKEYKLSYTGTTLWIYKEEFGKDMLLEANKLRNNFDFVSLCEFAWAMAKTNDETMGTFKDFMASITNPSETITLELMEEMIAVLYKDGDSKKEIKKKIFPNLMKK